MLFQMQYSYGKVGQSSIVSIINNYACLLGFVIQVDLLDYVCNEQAPRIGVVVQGLSPLMRSSTTI